MAVAIVFETHSLTTDNEACLATGWLDGRLSERGRALATELGRRRRNDGSWRSSALRILAASIGLGWLVGRVVGA